MQRLLGGRRPQRRGRHAAQADPDRGDPAVSVQPERVGHGHARDVVEAALRDLVERGDRGQWQRQADRFDQLVGLPDALPVTGEVVGQQHLALAHGRGQHQPRVQREQRRRGVADGRGRAQVAAERGSVADQPGRELREHVGQQRHTASQPGLDLGQAQRRAEVDVVRAEREFAQLGDPVDADGQVGAGVPDIQLDTPVRGAGHQPRVRVNRQQFEGLGQIGRADVAALRARGRGGGRRGRGFGQPGQQRVAGLRRPEGVGRVLNRPVPGAPAQVAAERVQVEPVRPVLMVGCAGSVQCLPAGDGRVGPVRPSARRGRRGRRGRGGRGPPPGPVVLGGHRADESRRAVAALRAAALGHLALDRVQPPGPAQALGGHDLLLVERRGRYQAGVDRHPAGPVRPVVAGDQHRAGAALALGAAFLAARQPAVAQPLEQRDVTADLAEFTSPAVDH